MANTLPSSLAHGSPGRGSALHHSPGHGRDESLSPSRAKLIFDQTKKSPAVSITSAMNVASITSNHIGTVLGSMPISSNFYKFKFSVQRNL